MIIILAFGRTRQEGESVGSKPEVENMEEEVEEE